MKDDFDKFQFEFPNLIQNIETAEEHKIVRGKTIFEETGFKWVLGAMSVGVFLLLGAAIFGGASGTNIGTLGMLAAAVGFYWVKVLGNKRKKEDNKELSL